MISPSWQRGQTAVLPTTHRWNNAGTTTFSSRNQPERLSIIQVLMGGDMNMLSVILKVLKKPKNLLIASLVLAALLMLFAYGFASEIVRVVGF